MTVEKLRFGVVGVGAIGKKHVDIISSGRVPGAELSAVVIRSEDKRREFAKAYPGVAVFPDDISMFQSGEIDAALLATPHGEHPQEAIAAFGRGLHVLTEKPAAMEVGDALLMNEAAEKSGKIFGIMYNQRTEPVYITLKKIISSGELGAIKRITWIVTDWYRSRAYHLSSPWHSTWWGEGGGVLINQSIHQLDLWQWLFGMPSRVWARAGFGKYHGIEVEDDVMAYFEYESGVTGEYITSTGETPGTNRLEIACDMGRVVAEGGKISFLKNSVSEREFEKINREPFARPDCEATDVAIEPGGRVGHEAIIANFTNVCLHGGELIAPGREGVNALMLANGAILSAWTGQWVELEDFPAEEYSKRLREHMVKA